MPRIIPIAACIVKHKEEILLLKRLKPPYAGMWSLVGGKIEYGEHPAQAAIRETKEETGLDASEVAPRGVFSEVLELNNGEKRHFIAFIFEITVTSKNNAPCNEGQLQWFKIGDWDNLKEEMIPSDWLLVKQALQEKPHLHIHEVKICQRVKNGKECYNLESIT